MEQVQRKLSPRESEPAQLLALIERGDFDGALALNGQLAAEMTFMPVDGWFTKRIEEKWGPRGKAIATDAWAKARANGEDWQREIRGMWDADCAAFRGRERLAVLGARLGRAKPRVEEARAKVAALEAGLVAAEPKAEIVPFALKELVLPGVAGEIQDYYLSSSMQPSQAISLAVGLMVPKALASGKVIGPSGPKGCALQQTVAVIAPPSGGKQFGIDTAKECLEEAGAVHLIGPNRFKSGPALVRFVKEHPVSLCVQDEFGRLLSKLRDPRSNPSEVEIK